MKRLAAVLLCFSLLLCVTACEEKAPSNANKSFQYHLDAEPKTLDPQIANDTSGTILIQALFEGLTRLDADGNPTPGVAESWTPNDTFTEFTLPCGRTPYGTTRKKRLSPRTTLSTRSAGRSIPQPAPPPVIRCCAFKTPGRSAMGNSPWSSWA